MNKRLWLLTGFLLVLTVLFSQTMFGATLFVDDFQDGNASGWSRSGGSWSVVNDDTYVYQQSSTSSQAYSYTGNSAWTDYTVEVKAKALRFNGSSRVFGVTARYSSTSNYYYLVLNNNNQLQLGKKSSKGSAVLASKPFTVQTDTWYTLKLSVIGKELKGYVNGELLLTATDGVITKGKCGVLALYTSARFDNFLVDGTASPTSPSPTPTLTPTPTQTLVVSPSPTATSTTGNPTPTPTPTPTWDGTYPPIGTPEGWASYNALGQNGTTGGAGGPIIHVYDKDTLEKVLYKDDNPAIVVIHGTLNGGPDMVNVKSNKTIVGAGNGAFLNFGLYIRGNNIIIKNLDIMNGGFEAGDSEGLDAVSFAADCHHVWIDHCTMHETRDGLVDPTRNARFVTISYCHFHTQKTAVLIGASDSDSAAKAAQSNSDKSQWHYTVTLHHNYWEGVYERAPRVRFGAVHVYNNFYNGNRNYAIGRGDRANIYSEANYFLNTHDAFAAYDDSNNPGYVKDVNSLFEGDNGPAQDNPPSGSWVWDPADYYAYTLHSAEWVKYNLRNYVGIGRGNP